MSENVKFWAEDDHERQAGAMEALTLDEELLEAITAAVTVGADNGFSKREIEDMFAAASEKYWADEAPGRAVAGPTCRVCGRQQLLSASLVDGVESVPVEEFEAGWTFTTDDGWICGRHET